MHCGSGRVGPAGAPRWPEFLTDMSRGGKFLAHRTQETVFPKVSTSKCEDRKKSANLLDTTAEGRIRVGGKFLTVDN